MSPDDFDFVLPEELIALEPAQPRDSSRLLHVRPDGLGHHTFRELPTLLRPGDVLVINDTKVFPAALTAIRPARAEGGGGDVQVDVNLLHPVSEEEKVVVWRAFARPAKRLREGDILHFGDRFSGEIVARRAGEIDLRVSLSADQFMRGLHDVGQMPLPPYIARKRGTRPEDRENYQTIFARLEGSVAAPTAGLHFTDQTFADLEARGISVERVTLHVGAGTFLPVTADTIEDHQMHAEWGEVTEETAQRLNTAMAEGRRIVSVGTTSTRLLESAAVSKGVLAPFRGETSIFITPGYEFKIIGALITNFHLPKSTLLMLISAFAGSSTIKAAYDAAVARQYRFYSYGDACLIEKSYD
ncbi:tRNA preQ1(34) S-adenosylmethionine ribosyltransferase-isomerase QueA [Parvularcula sp. LCG005]|uniref:tRNA preQ1(34) S-adenosylmethionine ribosyltransferase-isomerase QueA n=1 Tax=Parvularcula sp. LCG005 TaxID=3078805 RepID=UPI00294355FC|nr:tRNA preQ1(34) S-adenosylmethionine ribosyltransferase-isomerase QueA [Parvularcula sp. LCG005]WOI54577.1 tRNA preQ1(34) S-adenosylmethionine ribosyltransferase-isomerase QueA [Parvularcula sp. LCG005]